MLKVKVAKLTDSGDFMVYTGMHELHRESTLSGSDLRRDAARPGKDHSGGPLSQADGAPGAGGGSSEPSDEAGVQPQASA